MTEARPAIAYPGSRLEVLVEALDDIEEFAPEAYPLSLSSIHVELAEALHGKRNAKAMLLTLLEKNE
ncbi:MAG TPA: hypothetical protein ENH62_09385 [Marinobacter sp.]|uniref:Uncharacterized protein n=1 Tax=marine sediment metagenome TaxID=412755 RepID=A0A0F9PXZ0_9ZZZZ|nr:hypothetical protein [Marinobacter sp.]